MRCKRKVKRKSQTVIKGTDPKKKIPLCVNKIKRHSEAEHEAIASKLTNTAAVEHK